MLEAINKIYTFNKQAGLLDRPYNDAKEAEYVIEEALENLDTTYLANTLHVHEDATPKELSRAIVTGMCNVPADGIPDVDRLDKGLDQIVFAFGGLLKLGLSITDILKGLDVVMNANLSKLSVGLDSHGKQQKPKDWIAPEPLLQLILDQRKES